MAKKDEGKDKGKDDQKDPKAESRWDLDSYKAMEQRKGVYDWSRKNY